ncbi:MAG TPA: ABC transporter permease [Candidatus Limnocylindrales bacterium]|jgi:NitT/TauT family transport system permease protein
MSASGATAKARPSVSLGGRFGGRHVVAVLSLVVILALWQVFGPAQPLFASYPSAIFAAAVSITLPQILPAWGTTLVGFSVGLLIAIPLAIAIGVAMGRSRLIDTVLGPYVNALYVTPRIALIPLLVLWFGLEFQLRVAIVVLSAIFPMIVNTYTGMRHVDRNLLDVGRVFTATRRQRLRTIVLPGAMPYIFAGLRIGTARALGGIIVAEMTASLTGIGRRLVNYGTFFEIDKMFVAIISIGIFGLLLTRSLVVLQRRAAPWTHAVRLR